MLTFDMPSREVCVVRRQSTSTPLQPLVLLNDPQFVEAARHLAQLTLKQGGAKAEEREAFVLFVIEGFTISEIAQVTARSVEQIRQSINSARNHLMKKLPSSNPLKEKLLQYSSVA